MIHIEGVIVEIMPVKSGVGQSGREWKEREVVINHVTSVEYPKNVAVTFKGERADEIDKLHVGDVVGCDISIDAREYRGKWFNVVTGFGLEKLYKK